MIERAQEALPIEAAATQKNKVHGLIGDNP
jgi:hypothetical protein